ncbi:MAG: hypothetical protein LDLANPLL_02258 [Turneriella sp.]|nr:hypothetical protein [Turneriella sp.]
MRWVQHVLGALILTCSINAAKKSSPKKEEGAAVDPIAIYFKYGLPGVAHDTKERRVYWLYGLDAYYSYGSMVINFTDKPMQDLGEDSELKIYENLFVSPFSPPRYALLELSVYPLPIAGVAVRSEAYDFYQRAQVGGEGFNLIRSATRGYQEPYAVSLFLGNMARYRPLSRTPEEREINKQSGYQNSIGYTGYLISYGSHHIKDNELFRDNWVEAAWKIKGDQLFTLQTFQWDYGVGVKIHEHPLISNIAFLSVKRNRLDYSADSWDFLANSGFELRVDFKISSLRPVRTYFEVNKKWPIKKATAFVLVLGFTWESDYLYDGILNNYPGGQNFQVLLRPNITF